MKTISLWIFVFTSLCSIAECYVCSDWIDTVWRVMMLGELDRPATREDFQRFFEVMDWNGDKKVSSNEFDGIWLPCTQMTLTDTTEIFDLFASKSPDPNQDKSATAEAQVEAPLDTSDGSGEVNSDTDKPVTSFYDYFYHSASLDSMIPVGDDDYYSTGSVISNYIEPSDVESLWEFFMSGVRMMMSKMTDESTLTKTQFVTIWKIKLLPLLDNKGCPSHHDMFERVIRGHRMALCQLMSPHSNPGVRKLMVG